ncbi:hypothetical protein [Nonomuraea sp. NPDC049709]|uniref:hypothetical protein n=1 Tax=Nonomuraea sp. NPDC049709 TaxID=3154736 RepID=UPI00341539AD
MSEPSSPGSRRALFGVAAAGGLAGPALLAVPARASSDAVSWGVRRVADRAMDGSTTGGAPASGSRSWPS